MKSKFPLLKYLELIPSYDPGQLEPLLKPLWKTTPGSLHVLVL
jgi:hypothetical protein